MLVSGLFFTYTYFESNQLSKNSCSNSVSNSTRIFFIYDKVSLGTKRVHPMASRGRSDVGDTYTFYIILSRTQRSYHHNRCIYHTTFEGGKVFLLRQTNDLTILCPDEATAIKIYDIIGRKLQLPLEDEPPFGYFESIKDFNGIDVYLIGRG